MSRVQLKPLFEKKVDPLTSALREVFKEGEIIKALISEIDLEKGRIGLNTALLENSAGELIIDKQKVMQEATERALKTKALFDKKEQDK